MKLAATQVGAAAIVVAVAGYVAQFLAARWLGPAEYTRFAVFWAVMFMVVGCLSGVAQEVIRVSRLAKLRVDAGLAPSPADSSTPRIGVVAVGIGGSASIIVLLTGPLWGLATFGPDWAVAVALLSLAGFIVSGSLVAGGMVAGMARWRTYSLLVVMEGVARLLLFVLAAVFIPTVLGFSIAATLAFLPGVLVVLLWGPLRRESFAIRSDSGSSETTTRILRAMAATLLSSILVIGWPAMLSAAANLNPRGSDDVSLGVLILLVTLTRAPLMVPLTSFQNALVARFTGLDLIGRRRWVGIGVGVIVVGSAVLAALAALLGPPLLPLIFGSQYQADATLFGALTAATAGLGIITLTGVASITAARHNLYLLGWGVAITVTILTLFFAPLPFEGATVLALIIGPLSGAAVQLGALRAPGKPREVLT